MSPSGYQRPGTLTLALLSTAVLSAHSPSCSFVLGQLALAELWGQAAPWERRLAPTPIHVKVWAELTGLTLTGVGLGARESHHSTCELPQWQQPWLLRLCEKRKETKQNRDNLQGKKLLFCLGNLSLRSTGFQRQEIKTLGGKGGGSLGEQRAMWDRELWDRQPWGQG